MNYMDLISLSISGIAAPTEVIHKMLVQNPQ